MFLNNFSKMYEFKNVLGICQAHYISQPYRGAHLSLKRGISGLLYEKKMKLATEVAKYGRE